MYINAGRAGAFAGRSAKPHALVKAQAARHRGHKLCHPHRHEDLRQVERKNSDSLSVRGKSFPVLASLSFRSGLPKVSLTRAPICGLATGKFLSCATGVSCGDAGTLLHSSGWKPAKQTELEARLLCKKACQSHSLASGRRDLLLPFATAVRC